MNTKKLFNTSAYKTSKILERVLRDTGFRVYPELARSLVLEFDRGLDAADLLGDKVWIEDADAIPLADCLGPAHRY